MSEESHSFSIESAKPANPLARAEGWLWSVADHIDKADLADMALDQEALVYLRSRGYDCHDQVTAVVESWKTAEQARFDEYNQDIAVLDLRSGKKTSKGREPEANVTNFGEIFPIFLRDFWDFALLGECSLDASMLRTVDWCGITGFEQWWRRLTQPTRRTKTSARSPKKAPAARAGSKTAKILSLLQRPGGASLPELRKVTGWQAHSVRGFLSGAVKKKMGLRIHSVKRDNGERAYHVPAK